MNRCIFMYIFAECDHHNLGKSAADCQAQSLKLKIENRNESQYRKSCFMNGVRQFFVNEYYFMWFHYFLCLVSDLRIKIYANVETPKRKLGIVLFNGILLNFRLRAGNLSTEREMATLQQFSSYETLSSF